MSDREMMAKMAEVLDNYRYTSDGQDEFNNDDVVNVLAEYEAHIAAKSRPRIALATFTPSESAEVVDFTTAIADLPVFERLAANGPTTLTMKVNAQTPKMGQGTMRFESSDGRTTAMQVVPLSVAGSDLSPFLTLVYRCSELDVG